VPTRTLIICEAENENAVLCCGYILPQNICLQQKKHLSPAYLQQQLQSAIDAAARLVFWL